MSSEGGNSLHEVNDTSCVLFSYNGIFVMTICSPIVLSNMFLCLYDTML